MHLTATVRNGDIDQLRNASGTWVSRALLAQWGPGASDASDGETSDSALTKKEAATIASTNRLMLLRCVHHQTICPRYASLLPA